jgi:PRTRC genetic system protein E
MFKDLHELAQDATLMITVAAEAEQLRVSVTPVYAGVKPPLGARRPLSILGTPDELDADFTAALAIWQAPRRTVLQQAQDASEDEQDGEAASAPAKQKNKPGRKPKAPADTPPGQQDGGNNGALADAAGAASVVVDTLTADMFGGGSASATPPAADAPPASPGEAAASAAPAPAAALEVF